MGNNDSDWTQGGGSGMGDGLPGPSTKKGEQLYSQVGKLSEQARQAERQHGDNSDQAIQARQKVSAQIDKAIKAGWNPNWGSGSGSDRGRTRPGQTYNHERGGEGGSALNPNY